MQSSLGINQFKFKLSEFNVATQLTTKEFWDYMFGTFNAAIAMNSFFDYTLKITHSFR